MSTTTRPINQNTISQSYKAPLPGVPISRAKVQVLKDSAILSLKDFEQIKRDALFAPTPKILNTEQIRHNNALNLKNKILESEKNNPGGVNLISFEGQAALDLLAKQNKVPDTDDYVKELNKMCLYAKIATIRDRQLEERKKLEEIYKNKENRLDKMMECERLKEILFLEKKQEELKKQQKEGALVIIDQIKENEHERLKRNEQKEKERIQMLKALELLKEEEKKREEEKKITFARKAREAQLANEAFILNKKKKILEEKELDLQIKKFNLEKARQEEEFLAEKKRIAKEKEMELQRLREKQERAQDKQAEVDAIRAKRAYEESEKKAKLKEEFEAKEHKRKIEEMIKDNEMAKLKKKELEEKNAIREKEEFNKIIQENMKDEEKEKEKQRYLQELRNKNKEELIKQIKELENKNAGAKREILEEGRMIKTKLNEYRKNLEAIRQQKIRDLQALNIKEKYIVPIRQYKLADY
jgi:hypothetical protein